MMGARALAAASRQALTLDDVTQFTAGIAYPRAFASSRRSTTACPVSTPGFTDGGRLG